MTATIYLMTAEGWGEKKICTKGMVDGQKEGKGLGREDSFPRPLHLQIKHGQLNKRLRAS